MWYILFVVYAPYAMLPLPLRWCVLAGSGTALTHMAMTIATLVTESDYVRIFINFWKIFGVDTLSGNTVQMVGHTVFFLETNIVERNILYKKVPVRDF